MINFHKYGFLDVKKLQRYTESRNLWLNWHNPVWLFIWKDKYHPEIAYDNAFCFVRFFMPSVGVCYYPPFGQDLEHGLSLIQQDCREQGYDFNLSPADEYTCFRIQELGYELKQNENQENNICFLEEIAFAKKSRERRNRMKRFQREHPLAYSREIRKEDFPAVLEFVEEYRQSFQVMQDMKYFENLNALKNMMEHLYEFDLLAVLLMEEERIYGIAIGSTMLNAVHLHIGIALREPLGALDELYAGFAKAALRSARYLCVEENMGIEESRIMLKKEKRLPTPVFYSTFRL